MLAVTSIDAENLAYFRRFLLPEAADRISAGEQLPTVGLAEGTVACGAAAGYIEENEFQLLSLFVAPDYRRKGGGSLLLAAFREVLKSMPEIGSLEAHYTVTQEDHLALEPFFCKNGFRFEKEKSPYRSTTLGALSGKGFFASPEADRLPPGIQPFSEIPPVYVRLLEKRLAAEENSQSLFSADMLDAELSLGVVEDGKITACIIFDGTFPGRLNLAYAGSKPGEKAPMLFPVLLRSAFGQLQKRFPPETEVVLQTVTPESDRLAGKLLEPAGGGKCLSRYCSLTVRDEQAGE